MIKPVLDNKMSIFEDYRAFKRGTAITDMQNENKCKFSMLYKVLYGSYGKFIHCLCVVDVSISSR